VLLLLLFKYGGCSLMMFHTYEKDSFFVSQDFFQVPQPACFDSFGVSTSEW
jgi:hypothetical protein